MPLHRSGLVSRYALQHPDEPQAEPLPYERVLKGNPHHDPQTGRFTSGGGGRRGGTAGAPTEDAFGRPLRGRAGVARARTGLDDKDIQRALGDASHAAALRHGYDSTEHVAAEIARNAAVVATPITPYGIRTASIPAAITGEYRTTVNPAVAAAVPKTLEYRPALNPAAAAINVANPTAINPAAAAVLSGKVHVENPALPGFQFSNEQRRRHAREMFGSVGERAETYRQTGNLPSYEAAYRQKLSNVTFGTTARERSKVTNVRGSLKPRRSSFS